MIRSRLGNVVKLAGVMLLVSLVAACGGGGGGSSGGGSSSSSADYTSAATSASVTATVSLVANTVTLRWKDAFPAGTTFTVKSRNADGSFTAVETIPGTGDATVAVSWQRTLTSSAVYQIVANTNGVSTTLQSQGQHATVSATIPSTPPTITLSSPEPLSGTVTLSAGDPATYTSADWYIDLALDPSHTNGLSWNADLVPSGSHAILARIATGDDTYLEIGRTVTVADHVTAVQASTRLVSGATYAVDANATSVNGIASVSATIDGQSLGTLTQKNACSTTYLSCKDIYEFLLTTGSGTHTVVVTATDTAGHVAQTTKSLVVSNAPVVTLASPDDGSFAYNTLAISGTAASDKAGTVVTTTVTLSTYQVLQTTSASFSTNFSISGLAAGSYTLTVTAKDSDGKTTVVTRTITVTSQAGLAYSPFVKLGDYGELDAVENGKLLYNISTTPPVLRNASGTEVTLTSADKMSSSGDWFLVDGAVYGSGSLTGTNTAADCASFGCIYRWDASGTITNLSKAVSSGSGSDTYPVIKGGYVVWARGHNQLIVYKVADGSYTTIPVPSDATSIGNTNFDFTVSGGKVTVFFWAYAGSAYSVYKWASDTGVSQKISSDPVDLYTQTDGNTVAWLTSSGSPAALKVQPVGGGGTTTLSTSAETGFILRDGVLAWTDTGSPNAIKALYNGVTTTLTTTAQGLRLYANANGVVVYADNDKVYSWNAATGQKTLRIDSAPQQVFIADGYIYFTYGSYGKSAIFVFRVPLN